MNHNEELIEKEYDKITRLSNEIRNKQKEIVYAIQRYAQLKGEKVFVATSTYDVDFTDYYVAKCKDDIEFGVDCLFSVDVYFGDGEYHENITELGRNQDIIELEY